MKFEFFWSLSYYTHLVVYNKSYLVVFTQLSINLPIYIDYFELSKLDIGLKDGK